MASWEKFTPLCLLASKGCFSAFVFLLLLKFWGDTDCSKDVIASFHKVTGAARDERRSIED